MLGKRKKGLRDMLPGLENELRNLTNAEGLATSEGMEYLVERLGSRCDEGALSRDASWYTLHTALGHVALLGTPFIPPLATWRCLVHRPYRPWPRGAFLHKPPLTTCHALSSPTPLDAAWQVQ